MSRSILIAIFCGCVLGAVPVAAQDAMSPEQAVRRALDANPSARAALLEVRRADHAVAREGARYGFTLQLSGAFSAGSQPSLTVGGVTNPYSEQVSFSAQLARAFPWGMNVSLRADAARNFRRVVVLPTSPMIVSLGPSYGLDATLTLSQSFLRGFGEDVGLASLRSAEAERQIATSNSERQVSALCRDVLIAYWELWYAARSVEIERASSELAIAQRDEAGRRVELGALAEADRLAFETRVATLSEALAVARASLRMRASELGRLTGMSGAEPAIRDDAPVEHAIDVDDAVRVALEVSPELRGLRDQLALAEVSSRGSGDALRPRLDAQAQVGVHGLGYDDAAAALAQVGTFNAVTASVSLVGELPFEDTAERAERARASLAIEVAEANVEAAQQSIAAAVETQREALLAARERVRLSGESARIAGQTVEAEHARFEIGTRIATSVLEAESQLRQARLRVARAQVDAAIAEAQLEHLTGALVSRWLRP